MQTLLYDLRFALRQVTKSPGMAILAVFTLALGIGANTAIFGLLDKIAWRMLPVHNFFRTNTIPATSRPTTLASKSPTAAYVIPTSI